VRIELYRWILIAVLLSPACCLQEKPGADDRQAGTWAERLGFPEGSHVLILHADDVGLTEEANQATINYLEEGQIQSASCMVPCPGFEAFAAWAKENPEMDIGLHITLNSEWLNYRWRSVAPPEKVPGLLDEDGFLWPDVQSVVDHAGVDEVATEIRAQVEKAISLGLEPDHIDTHMGVLLFNYGLLEAYLQVAEEYGIPALTFYCSKPAIEKFKEVGITLTDDMARRIDAYDMPKVDDCLIVDSAKSYQKKCWKFLQQVAQLRPGITHVVFHPCTESENLKEIISDGEQRIWEAQLFSDPLVIKFLKEKDILFTNWPELVKRYQERF